MFVWNHDPKSVKIHISKRQLTSVIDNLLQNGPIDMIYIHTRIYVYMCVCVKVSKLPIAKLLSPVFFQFIMQTTLLKIIWTHTALYLSWGAPLRPTRPLTICITGIFLYLINGTFFSPITRGGGKPFFCNHCNTTAMLNIIIDIKFKYKFKYKYDMIWWLCHNCTCRCPSISRC